MSDLNIVSVITSFSTSNYDVRGLQYTVMDLNNNIYDSVYNIEGVYISCDKSLRPVRSYLNLYTKDNYNKLFTLNYILISFFWEIPFDGAEEYIAYMRALALSFVLGNLHPNIYYPQVLPERCRHLFIISVVSSYRVYSRSLPLTCSLSRFAIYSTPLRVNGINILKLFVRHFLTQFCSHNQRASAHKTVLLLLVTLSV